MNSSNDPDSGADHPALPQSEGANVVARGEALAAGLVVGEAARRLQTALDELGEGQARLAADL